MTVAYGDDPTLPTASRAFFNARCIARIGNAPLPKGDPAAVTSTVPRNWDNKPSERHATPRLQGLKDDREAASARPLAMAAAEIQDIFPSECRRCLAHYANRSMALVPSLQAYSAVAPGIRKKPSMPNSGSKNVLKRNERLQVMLSDVELKVIDAWRFEAMMPSRAAAIRTLIRRGLEASGMDTSAVVKSADTISEVPKSDDIGIV